ncbi:MAG: hypothetical protein EHM58_08680 [Ignavibacteriae bacterium]|nr:MAG: hypothetical protein EHM58_08680 [Ignavibacteriota bacterium]
MKYLLITALLIPSLINSQNHDVMKMEKEEVKTAVLIPGMGNFNHTVSTKNTEAQKFFNQGFTLLYGFNHNEAINSFNRVIELDSKLAMAYWGIAFALGPNYNLPADNEQRKQAWNAMNKALELSKYASEREQDYIQTLSKRYAEDLTIDQKKLDVEFKNAMKELHQKYPDDLDAATLYAESLMDLKPWALWNSDGTPAEGTLEIVTVLEDVLRREPNHIGANHYYIHAVEASTDPGRGLNSAKVLGKLVPSAGHLVHMPAHIFFRVGDYEGASVANINAIESDNHYIKTYNPQGVYPLMYYNHNINFLAASRMMEGNYAEAIKNANIIVENVRPALDQMPMLQGFYANALMVMLSFNKWNELLSYPVSNENYGLYAAILHYSRGTAFASTGNIADAKIELNKLAEDKNKITDDVLMGQTSGSLIANLLITLLNARISWAEGDKVKAIDFYTTAVEQENNVAYDEPPDWYPSVRIALGGALYSNGQYTEAEQVYRDELKKYPHNGRGLFGLMSSLKAQGKNDEASLVEEEYQTAWKNADTELDITIF